MAIRIHKQSSIQDLYQMARNGSNCWFDAEARSRVEIAYQRLLEHLDTSDSLIYGIHTRYGSNVGDMVDANDWQSHQQALLLYLKVGLGKFFPVDVVRRALCLQAYKIGLGFSGLHPLTYDALLQLTTAEVMPDVPCLGSLGASGDLIPMAHAVAPLFAQQEPLGPRDVISLVNTNAMMASLAIELWSKSCHFYREAHLLWLIFAEALGWKDFGKQTEGWRTRGSERRFRAVWIEEVDRMHQSLATLTKSESREPPKMPAQERYSIRCAPQILQDLGENLLFAAEKISEEALGLADNPVVLEDSMWHGGHFYTAGLATAADLMNDAVSRMSDMIDRQILLLVTPETNHELPANLMQGKGDHVKGLHQLASSLVQKMRSHQASARSLSFSCESNNQDVVPASMNALLQLDELLELAHQLTRIGSFVGERALLMRLGQTIPDELTLTHWPSHESVKTWERCQLSLPFRSLGSE